MSSSSTGGEKSRVDALNEHQQSQQHQQYQQQTTDTSTTSTTTTTKSSVQQQEQMLSASLSHGLVLHESDSSALENSIPAHSHASGSSSAAIFASDEPINTFVDLQSSEPVAATIPAAPEEANNLTDSNILIEIVQKAEAEPATPANAAGNRRSACFSLSSLNESNNVYFGENFKNQRRIYR